MPYLSRLPLIYTDTQINVWRCLQFNALIPVSVLVTPPADAPYVNGAGYNSLCGLPPTLTPPTHTSLGGGVLTSSSLTAPTYTPPGGSVSSVNVPTYTVPGYGPPQGSPTKSVGGGLTSSNPIIIVPTYPPISVPGTPTRSGGGVVVTPSLPGGGPPGYGSPAGKPTHSGGGAVITPSPPGGGPPGYGPPSPTNSAGGGSVPPYPPGRPNPSNGGYGQGGGLDIPATTLIPSVGGSNPFGPGWLSPGGDAPAGGAGAGEGGLGGLGGLLGGLKRDENETK